MNVKNFFLSTCAGLGLLAGATSCKPSPKEIARFEEHKRMDSAISVMANRMDSVILNGADSAEVFKAFIAEQSALTDKLPGTRIKVASNGSGENFNLQAVRNNDFAETSIPDKVGNIINNKLNQK